MRRNIVLSLLCLVTATLVAQTENPAATGCIDLSGEWQFARDEKGLAVEQVVYGDHVVLPGTVDTNRKGDAPATREETTHLTRVSGYVGRAWYSREVVIPKEWKKKCIQLTLERTKPAEVYVDGHLAGKSDDICTPQRYDLTPWLTPGRHTIAIMVDNGTSLPPQLLSNSHACTEDTQTNWNGIIGQLSLTARPQLHISDLQVRPDVENGQVEVTFTLQGKVRKNTRVEITACPETKNGLIASQTTWPGKRQLWTTKFNPNTAEKTPSTTYTTILSLKGEKALWDEFTPDRYVLTAETDGGDKVSVTFGLTDFRAEGMHFSVNGHRTFLRGKHDACVFPLTAHVPMGVDEWTAYLLKNKEYGINHLRFHSWCPPEAAFEAADRLGIYLQPELPFWGDFNPADERLMTFLHKEGEHIMREYGHHPSFVMFALGNELWGSIEKMGEFVTDFRRLAPNKLFTFGSNYYLGYQGVKPGMDYFTTCRVGGEAWGATNTHTRGSFAYADVFRGGLLNTSHPNTKMNLEQGCALSTVPVISHETAQFQTYPDYSEIAKYTGVLYPYNMEVFRSRLERAGMADQAKDFHRASGRWSLQLYKADIELDLRTEDMAGFQLLDLQDYPGQGSAYVGILDAFMDSKGLTTPREWRQWCSQVVPLLETEKMCYTADETLCGEIKMANYSGHPLAGTLCWALTDGQGHDVVAGSTPFDVGEGLDGVTSLSIPLTTLGDAPRRYDFRTWIADSQVSNSWPIWVYPKQESLEPLKKGILITRQLTDDVARQLEKGARVLLMPDSASCGSNTVGPLFQTDYWNYRMFKTISENNKREVSPGTLGILTRPEHPLFNAFPTEEHTNWQWFPVVSESRPFMLDNTAAAYRPIVQVIDNIERNHKLGLVFEFSVGKGRLLVVMSDLERASQYAEGKQFYISVLKYMQSADFQPQTRITIDDFRRLLSTPVVEGKIGELNNISPY